MNAITTQTTPSIMVNQSLAMLMDVQKFEHMCRVGKMLAVSPLFPAHLRGGSVEQATANAVLVLNMANRLNEDPLTVAQSIYFVGGRPGWNTTYMIAKANQHGVFRDVIDWEVKGKGETLSVAAIAVLQGTGKRVSVICDMEMAKKEGWTKNAKYQSIPEQMLRYRSAAFLIRLYCPEVMIGVPSAIEIELEARDITPDGGPVVVEANEDAPIEVKAENVEPDRKAEAAKAKDDAEKEAKAQAERKRMADIAETAAAEAANKAAITASAAAEAKPVNKARDEPSPDREQFEYITEMILTELDSGAASSDVLDMYGPQIDQIKTHFPELAAKISAAMSGE